MKMIRPLFMMLLLALWTPSAKAILKIQDLATQNGVKAWFVEDHSVPVVSLVMSFEAGQAQAPKGKAALPGFLAALLVEGAGDMDAKAFAERLQNKGIALSVSSDTDRFFVSLRTPRRHWEEALSLCTLMLTKPRFDPDAFERVRQSMVQGLENAKLTPQWKAGDAFGQMLYKGHPYGARVTSPEDINAINVKDLEHFLRQCVAVDRIVVGVCGDVSSQDVTTALEGITKALPPKGTYTPVADVPFPAKGETLSLASPHPQSVVMFAHPGLPSTHPDAIKLFVVTYVLGGGSFHSWMMEEIRTKKGYAYDAGCGLSNSEHSNLVTANLQSDGKTVYAAMDLTRALFAKLKNEGITQKELDATKSFLEGNLPLNLSSSLSIASILHGLQVDKRPIDYLEIRAARIKALTLEDVNTFAKAFFEPERLVGVVAGTQGPLPTSSTGEK